jgi:D-alanine-D-alanine ligase
MTPNIPLKPLRVAILANLRTNAPKWDDMLTEQWDELDSENTVLALATALEARGHQTEFMEGGPRLVDTLPKWKPDICFNICEGHFGDARESQVPALLEMLRVPYTGSRVTALALTLDKALTKRVLAHHGLPTPEFQVFRWGDEALDQRLTFPLFAKPMCEGTGIGVSADSILQDEADLRRVVPALLNRYQQPVLVERFIIGREVTIGLVGNPRSPLARGMAIDPDRHEGFDFFAPLEVMVNDYPEEEGGIYSSRLKTVIAHDFHYRCPAEITSSELARLQALTAHVFLATGCLDIARVDFRLDASAKDAPQILEINPLPGLSPGFSDLCVESEASGWSHEQLVNRILDEAALRYHLYH